MGKHFLEAESDRTANSLIRLCSISKVFAGEMLTELANEGKVRLTDPLQRFAPPKRIVPKGAGGTPITLLDLATHTSGLPREVGPYPANTPHFTFPDRTFRWTWLPNRNSSPGRARLPYIPTLASIYSVTRLRLPRTSPMLSSWMNA